MIRVENYLFELKEHFNLEIHEDLENYVLNKYQNIPNTDESDILMRQEVLYDLHSYQAASFEEKNREFNQDVNSFYADSESLIEEHSQAMKILDKFGLTYLLHHPDFFSSGAELPKAPSSEAEQLEDLPFL